jgi:ubiquinone/menaquinone biosynthesis C-methylase UbiE
MSKVLKTSKYDPITRLEHWNPLIRKAYKSRFLVCFQQLKKNNGKLLELGIGSGYTIPHLSHQGFKVYGIDLHGKLPDIKNGYQEFNVFLIKADAQNLPFIDCSFDSLVAISLLEHLDEPEKTLLEIKRVLKEDGEISFGIPVKNLFTQLWFLLSRSPATHEHKSHKIIVEQIRKNFKVVKKVQLSLIFPYLHYYIVLRCKKS